MKRQGYQSFGNLDRRSRKVLDSTEAMALLRTGSVQPNSLLAFGNGRSYGDTCHNDAGILADMRAHGRIISFDLSTGVLEAESGAMLSDIIEHASPHGYFPAVVPGTRHVTLGGAIANDIHGKNHHRRGTFGCHVTQLSLLRSDGREYLCSPERNAKLFRATIGGMGLTGLITTASIRLMRVPSLAVEENIVPFGTLSEYFELAARADEANEYAVAWVDQLAGKGRGLLLTGNHARGRPQPAGAGRRRLSVPFDLPVTVLNRPFVKAFNAAYRLVKTRGPDQRVSAYGSFFFPLDGLGNWNRFYGAAGLYQHQSVIPAEAAPLAVPELLRRTRDAGHASFLTVLKRFGDIRSPGLLSFPRAGYTLTLDFPNCGAKTLKLLAALDEITVQAGGAVNPYKDARMGPQTFAASFPRWRELESMRDPAFMSDFWTRTAMRLPQARLQLMEAAE